MGESLGHSDLRKEQEAVAEWVIGFASSGYGPWGGRKLVEGDPPGLVRSPASALAEVGVRHPALAPYRDLAHRVQAQAGDQATGALLVAARLVQGAAAALAERPHAAAPWRDGYALAQRQALASLASLRRPKPAWETLSSVVPAWKPRLEEVVPGIALRAERRGVLDLDSIDITIGPELAWLDGVLVRPQHTPPARIVEGPVALVQQGWRSGPLREGFSYRVGPHAPEEFVAAEEKRRLAALERVTGLGIVILASGGEIENALAARLRGRGVVVWNDAPHEALARLARLTGSTPTSRLDDLAASDLGNGKAARRRHPHDDWVVTGRGPGATLEVPAMGGTAAALAKDDGERLVRAAGLVLVKPEGVPGGGRWQRAVARDLLKAADHAPGRAALAVRHAGAAVSALADDLVRNAGLDPLRTPLPGDANEVWDPAPCVRIALAAACECARQLVSQDARHSKEAPTVEGLTGGGTPKTLREMAGDVPRDM
ncbi:MAG: TCP-1/cpn60 chaperonin family protein [Thermoplasmatota archaeon]